MRSRPTGALTERPRGLLVLTALVLAPLAAPASAMETDQYLAWFVELRDSSGPINAFVNHRLEQVLQRVNRRHPDLPCQALPGRLFRDLQRTLVTSRMRRFLHKSPDVDRFPDRSVGYWKYRKLSVFRRKTFPVFLPMARTIRIGEIYLGTDKLGHMFGFGRRYHAQYRRATARGVADEEARRRAILRGLAQERTIVGGLVDGIVSNSDLEANYQGFRLALDLCEGPRPLLVRGEKGWRLDRAIDLRDYINPAFDESYNPSRFLSYRWRLVEPVLAAEYCGRLDAEAVQKRFDLYRSLDRPSFSRRVLAEQNSRKGRRPQEHFTAAFVCRKVADGERTEVAVAGGVR